MLAKRLRNGKRTVGIYTPTLALNTQSAARFITTCYLKKANRTKTTFFLEKEETPISLLSSARAKVKVRPKRLWIKEEGKIYIKKV